MLVKSGYNKPTFVVTQLSTLNFENHSDKNTTAVEKTFRDVISWNIRVIVVLDKNCEIETKHDVTIVREVLLNG